MQQDAALYADAAALDLVRASELIAAPLARAAAAFHEGKGWTPFGFSRLDDYTRERLGRTGRWLRDLARLGRALERWPGLREALTGVDGGRPLGRAAALLVARAVEPSLAGHGVSRGGGPSVGPLDWWIALARSRTVRELRAAVTAARRGGGDPGADIGPTAGSRRHPRGAEKQDETAGIRAARSEAARSQAARPCASTGAFHPPSEPDASAGGAAVTGAPGPISTERLRVRLRVPEPIREAFDETLDLHRAVSGRQTGVASFVESLVAEAWSGMHPPSDAEVTSARTDHAAARDEDRLARESKRWERLPAPPAVVGGDDAVVAAARLARETEAAYRDCAARAGRGDARELDAQLRMLIDCEERIHRRLGGLLSAIGSSGACVRLGFRGLEHYAEERLGLGRSASADRVRVHRALARLPRAREAYETGALGLEAALWVVRCVGRTSYLLRGHDGEGSLERACACNPAHRDGCGSECAGRAGSGCRDESEPEAAWVRRALEATVKRLRDEGRELARRRASSPDASLAPLSDAEWHASLRRDPGRTRERVRDLGMRAIEHAQRDVGLGLRLPAEIADDFLGAVEARRRRLESAAAMMRPDVRAAAPVLHGAGATRTVAGDDAPGRRTSSAAGTRKPAGPDPPRDGWPEGDGGVRTFSGSAQPPVDGTLGQVAAWSALAFSAASRPVPAWVGLLSLLEEYAEVWDDPRGMPRRRAEATYRRDGWRCTAPGCTSRRNLEEHHVVYRSRGGGNAPENRICACRFHHLLGEHGVLASCRGRAPLGVVWVLGKDGIGGSFRNERRL